MYYRILDQAAGWQAGTVMIVVCPKRLLFKLLPPAPPCPIKTNICGHKTTDKILPTLLFLLLHFCCYFRCWWARVCVCVCIILRASFMTFSAKTVFVAMLPNFISLAAQTSKTFKHTHTHIRSIFSPGRTTRHPTSTITPHLTKQPCIQTSHTHRAVYISNIT